LNKKYGLYSSFEQLNQENISINIPEMPNSISETKQISLHRPRLLLSHNQNNWYKYDFETFSWQEQTPSEGTYFSRSEITSKGNTFSEYEKIPKETITSFSSESNKLYFLITEYMPPILTSHNYWINHYSENNFLWTIRDNSRVMVFIGEI
jgi:hypothetical protein